jgi:hypothetical protein
MSCDYNIIAKFLLSCALFYVRNVDLAAFHVGTVEPMDEIVCHECLNWNEFADYDMTLFAPPPNYPQEMLPPNKMVKAKCVEYQDLTLHVKYTHFNIANGGWTKTTGVVFLR